MSFGSSPSRSLPPLPRRRAVIGCPSHSTLLPLTNGMTFFGDVRYLPEGIRARYYPAIQPCCRFRRRVLDSLMYTGFTRVL